MVINKVTGIMDLYIIRRYAQIDLYGFSHGYRNGVRTFQRKLLNSGQLPVGHIVQQTISFITSIFVRCIGCDFQIINAIGGNRFASVLTVTHISFPLLFASLIIQVDGTNIVTVQTELISGLQIAKGVVAAVNILQPLAFGEGLGLFHGLGRNFFRIQVINDSLIHSTAASTFQIIHTGFGIL